MYCILLKGKGKKDGGGVTSRRNVLANFLILFLFNHTFVEEKNILLPTAFFITNFPLL